MQQEPYRYPFPTRTTTPVAITHVTVVPMDTERLLFDQTILIEDGHITALAPSSSICVEPFFTIVDGTGRYVIPGLADMHVHFWAPGDAAMFLAYGVTVVRNMSGAPFHLAFQRKVQRRELPGPYLVTTGPIFEGGAPILPPWRIITEPGEAAQVVQQCVQRGYQQLKVYNRLTPQTLRALGNGAAEAGLRMTGHCPDALTFEEAIAAGMTCFEHLTGIWRGHLKPGFEQRPDQYNLDLDVLRIAAEQMDFEAIRRLAHQMAARQIWNCPTLVAFQHMHEAQTACLAHPTFKPLLRYIPQMEMNVWEWLDPSRYRGRSYEPWHEMLHARNRIFSLIVSLLHEEGLPCSLGRIPRCAL